MDKADLLLTDTTLYQNTNTAVRHMLAKLLAAGYAAAASDEIVIKDYGCGQGNLGKLIVDTLKDAGKPIRYMAYDAELILLHNTAELWTGHSDIHTSFEKADIFDRYFLMGQASDPADIIIASHVLYNSGKEFAAFIKACLNGLKPNGLTLFINDNVEAEIQMLRRKYGIGGIPSAITPLENVFYQNGIQYFYADIANANEPFVIDQNRYVACASTTQKDAPANTQTAAIVQEVVDMIAAGEVSCLALPELIELFCKIYGAAPQPVQHRIHLALPPLGHRNFAMLKVLETAFNFDHIPAENLGVAPPTPL